MPTYPLTLPPSPAPREARVRLLTRAAVSESPMSGIQQVFDWGVDQWSLDLSFPPVRDEYVDLAVSAVDTGADTLTSNAHGLANGYIVRVSSTGSLPGGLSAATDYYVVSAATNTIKLSATAGGSAIDLTSAGSGAIKIHWDRLAAWHQFFRDLRGRVGTFSFNLDRYVSSPPLPGTVTFRLLDAESGWDVDVARFHGFSLSAREVPS